MPVQLVCTSPMGIYTLVCSMTYIGLYDSEREKFIWTISGK